MNPTAMMASSAPAATTAAPGCRTLYVAGLAEDLGVDVGPVLEGIGHDPRIGHTYMRPSYGFAGAMEPGWRLAHICPRNALSA